MSENCMKLCTKLLLNETGISNDAKYFLMRVLYIYGSDQVVADTTHQLIGALCISSRSIKKARDELVKKGYVELVPLRMKGAVKPRKSFRVSPDWIAKSLADSVELPVNDGFIKEVVLFGQQRKSYMPQVPGPQTNRSFTHNDSHNLAGSNRILLATLLAHSDGCGVVQGVGLSRLSALTGFKRDKLKDRLTKLSESGYIRSIHPGNTGKTLFGVFEGIYYLNLKHPAYRYRGGDAPIFLYYAEKIVRDPFMLEADKIFTVAYNYNRSGRYIGSKENYRSYRPQSGFSIEYDKELKNISFFFGDKRSSGVISRLQIKFYEYASWLLSNCWESLQILPKGAVSQMKNRVKAEVFAPKLLSGNSQDLLGDLDNQDRFAGFILSVSQRIAQMIQELILSSPCEVDFEQFDFNILPAPYGGLNFDHYQAIECFPKTKGAGVAEYWRLDWVYGLDGPAVWEGVEEISETETYLFGLSIYKDDSRTNFRIQKGNNTTPE